jgi:hypothetical protein
VAEADAAELGPGLLGPRRRAQPLEDRDCLAERVGGGAPLLDPAVQAPLDEPIPREVERELRRLVDVELVERGERRRDVAYRVIAANRVPDHCTVARFRQPP